MARSQKQHTPPNNTYEIKAPKALVPLMQAFHVDDEKDASILIMEVVQIIWGQEGNAFEGLSKEELEGVSYLMKGINPRDTLETLYAAQIVASHMLGMRKLSASHPDDQRLGLKLLRFSNETMQKLSKKRHGGMHNITVNYNERGTNHANPRS